MHLIKKLFKGLKNGIEILVVGQAVLELLIQTQHFDCLICNLKTAWPTLILMLFLSSLDNLLYLRCVFQKDVDNFEIEHKTC